MLTFTLQNFFGFVTLLIFEKLFATDLFKCRVLLGIQWIVSLNYRFRRLLIPSDFLKRIVISNFRDFKNVILGTEKGSIVIFGKAIRTSVFRKSNPLNIK